MIDYREVKKIYFYGQAIDMRAGMHKLQILLCCNFSAIAMMNTLFVFCAKDRKTIKIYYENEYGSWLLINKLSYLKYQWPVLEAGKGYRIEDMKAILKGLKVLEERNKEIGF